MRDTDADTDALAATACKRKVGGRATKPVVVDSSVKKKRGRPPGSRNKKTQAKLAANQGVSSNPAATKRAKVAQAKPTRHESTATISGTSESEDASDGSSSESESDASMVDEVSDGLSLSDSD